MPHSLSPVSRPLLLLLLPCVHWNSAGPTHCSRVLWLLAGFATVMIAVAVAAVWADATIAEIGSARRSKNDSEVCGRLAWMQWTGSVGVDVAGGLRGRQSAKHCLI